MIHKRQEQDAKLYAIKLLAVIVNTALFAMAWYLFYSARIFRGGFYRRGDYVIIILYAFIYALMAKIYNGMDLRTSRISELIYSQGVAIFISSGLMYLVIILLSRRMVNILPLVLQVALSCVVSSVWSCAANKATNMICRPARILLVYDNINAYKNGKNIIDKLPWRFQLVQEVKMADIEEWTRNRELEFTKLKSMIVQNEVEAVMLCGLASSQRNDILKYGIENDIRVFIRPNIGDFIISNAEILQMASLPVFICQKSTPGLGYVFAKRVLDLVVSICGMVIVSPILLLTALAIKLNDHGPVLYKQERLTKNGKTFNVLKFRSMRIDAEKDGVARLSAQGDSRITSVGKVIRACRIDELPQIFNIIKGDMSLVGPRPERPQIAEQYEKEMPEFALRLQTKAGLTGYAQVYGKYNTEPYDKLQMDLMYIAKQNIATDFKLIFATIKILFTPESTEGINAGATTAMTRDDIVNEDEKQQEMVATQEVKIQGK